MKQGTVFLIIAIGAISCTSTNSPLKYPGNSEKQKLANEIRSKVANELKKKEGLRPGGTIGQMMNEIQVLGLAFDCYRPVDIVEGRRLLIWAVDTMLKEVNQDTRIHPYLSRNPFRPWNVQIQIFVHNPDGTDVSPGNLCIIEAVDGTFIYKIDDPVTKMLVRVYKETYDEAVARLADPSLPLVPFQSDPKMSVEQLKKLRKGISFVSDDGAIWHLDENGCWAKDPRSEK